MKKKVIAFDLDDTISVTKSPMSDQMARLLTRLLEKYDVCIISGGKIEQFHIQVIDRLDVASHHLNGLHLMPTCGTRYYRYDELKKEWTLQYAEDIPPEERRRIVDITEATAKKMRLWPDKPHGDVIEDRKSQISISMLGQLAPPEEKYSWAKKHSARRLELRERISEQLPEYEVRAGGSTTIDITHIGIDKAYGMNKLIDAIAISKDDILFIGDKLQEGGNDYPVKAMGIDTIEVDKWQDTAFILQGILAIS